MLEDRQHNALAALDIFQNVIRADSLSGDVARWQRAFDEAKRAGKPLPAKPAPAPARNDAVFNMTIEGRTLGKREIFNLAEAFGIDYDNMDDNQVIAAVKSRLGTGPAATKHMANVLGR